MRLLVTIDDPITIIEPHRVLLEWVDQVHRDGFYVRSTTSGSHITIGALEKNRYRHDAEGTTWARGHHLPDSEVVVALRAAASLVPRTEKPAAAPDILDLTAALVGADHGFDLKRLMEDAKKAVDDAKKTAEEARKSWWQIHWRR